ncbi:hypothetical protein JGU66_30920 [Myxococcaceae bacterium JPH2]|nr:hypothetical protein [Myxococcaceae bacterium JPH2]
MKRSTLAALMLGAAGLTGACSDTTTTAGAAGLSGTYDVALVDPLVFVTSQDQNELRVLDLDSSPRQFMPAPNPLQPLAIPVLERPDALTRDTGYDAAGFDVRGPYVYARSSGGQRISVVAADRSRLVEVQRLDVGALLTAFAARSPAADGAPSVLYYALQTQPAGMDATACPAGVGVIMRQELPGPDALASASLPAPTPVFCMDPQESALSLVVLPKVDASGTSAGEPEPLAVALRNVNRSSANPGATLSRTIRIRGEVTAAGPKQTPLVTYTRPEQGAGTGTAIAARLLATHSIVQSEVVDGDGKVVTDENGNIVFTPVPGMGAGRFIYAVLDELTCTGASCVGVIAIDSETGQLAKDVTGADMLTLLPPAGLPTGLTLHRGLNINNRSDSGTAKAFYPLLGIMPSSDGTITLFRADTRRALNLSTSVPTKKVELRDALEVARSPQPDNPVQVVQGYRDPNDPLNVIPVCTDTNSLCGGSLPSITWRIVANGVLPGLSAVARDVNSPVLTVDAAQGSLIQDNDLISLQTDTVACSTNLRVKKVTLGDGRVQILDTAVTPLPTDCAAYGRFSVLADGAEKFVLYSGTETSDNYVRRLAGATYYEILQPSSYYYHPDNFGKPGFPATPPSAFLYISYTTVQAGDRYVVGLSSGYRPYVFSVDNSSTSGLSAFRLPGPVVAAEVNSNTEAYIAYPSADGILQVTLQVVVDNEANLQAVRSFQ